MIRSQGPLEALASPQLSFDATGVPHSERFGDSFFSRAGGLEECRHVFLEGNRIEERLRENDCKLLCIGELGFGTGLNFLSTWKLFRQTAEADMRLHYWSIDGFPLRRAELERALALWPELKELTGQLLAACPPPIESVHRRVFDGGRVVLDCVWADAATALSDLGSFGMQGIDAWYLDGFAPSRNPQMWEHAVLAQLPRCSSNGATLASYSAAGSVRRGLSDVGFSIRKRPGFGHKRECIAGELRQEPVTAPSTAPRSLTPWDLFDRNSHAESAEQNVVIIGAGLAGAHCAAALARRGVTSTVLDAGEIANGGSGNGQGILFTRLSHQRSTLSDFSLLAHGFAHHLYRKMFDDGRLRAGRDGELNGCFQLPGPRGDHAALVRALAELPELAEPLSAPEAQSFLGEQPASEGIWQAQAGWLVPPGICRALLDDERITVRDRLGILTPAREDNHWCVRDAGGSLLARAPVLVLASALATRDMLELHKWLPLKPVRGQTSTIPAAGLTPLRASYCHSGYIAPAVDGAHNIGATFAPGVTDTELDEGDHAINLKKLAEAFPAWGHALRELNVATLRGHAALRATTPDYLPIAGPLPDYPQFLTQYAALGSDARQLISAKAPVLPGAYISCGYGSRGLSYAALCGELVACQITGEAPPLSRELHRAVSPARFLTRALVRGSAKVA